MKPLKEEGGMGTPWPFPVLPEPNYVRVATQLAELSALLTSLSLMFCWDSLCE